jgi:hypothetical protein
MQRGCTAVSSNDSTDHTQDSSNLLALEDELDASEENEVQVDEESDSGEADWHEAIYVLSIKEKYLLSQVAVDQVISCTKQLVSDVLGGVVDKVRGNLPLDAMNLIQKEVSRINSSLFKRVSTAAMQKKYFKDFFNLVVSDNSNTVRQLAT